MIPIFADFETYYSKEYSLKKMSTQEYIHSPEFKVHGCGVAIGKDTPRWFSGEPLNALLPRLVPGNVIVCHNANFDAAILAWHYGLKPKLIIDTVSLSRAVIGERWRSHSLSSIAKYLLQDEKGGFLQEVMGVRDLSPSQEQLLASYCLHDVDLCRRIFYALIPHLPKKELLAMDMVSRMFTEPSLILDKELLVKYHSEVVANKMNLMDFAGVENAKELNSNPQFADALKRLGVEPPTKISPTTGKETWAFAKTDEGLQALEDHKDERVQALVAARLGARSTLAETRAATLIKAADYGPFPVSYLFSGAQTTHRLSGSGGANMQNLPRGGTLRRAIMAPEGYTCVVADLAQIELRGTLALAVELMRSIDPDVAERSEEKNALDTLSVGADLYSSFGSVIYQTQITKETHPLERQIAKSAVLGLGFGMGKDKFIAYCRQQNIAMDEATAERIVKLYRGTYTGVVRLWRYMQDSVREFLFNGVAKQLFKEPDVWLKHTSLYGDPCIGLAGQLQIKYPGLAYDPQEKGFSYDRSNGKTKMFAGKYVENLVQYLARQVIMEQTVAVSKKYKVAMSTHDEICVVVPEETWATAADQMEKLMTTSPSWWPSLPLGVDIHKAERYGNAK